MNILIVYDYLSGILEGGSDRILYEHSKRLKERGHTLKILTTGEKESYENDFFNKDIEIFRSRVSDNRFLRFFQTLWGIRELFDNLTRDVKFDVINFHQPLSAAPVLCHKKSKNSLTVYTFHSPWHLEYEIENNSVPILRRLNSLLRKKAERFCLNRCDKIVVLSEYSRNMLTDIHGIDKDKISLIPGGIDTEKFKPASSKAQIRKKLSLPPDKFIIFSIRSLRRRTGLVELISASRRILEKDNKILLVISGGGPRRKEVEDLVGKSGLKSKIVLTGFVSADILPLYYQASDLFVMPTQKLEGFGLALLEAMSSGLPVMATPVGAISEILSGLDKRCLFEGITEESLAKGLEEVIANNEMRRSMADKARDYAIARYSWDNIINRLENVFLGRHYGPS